MMMIFYSGVLTVRKRTEAVNCNVRCAEIIKYDFGLEIHHTS